MARREKKQLLNTLSEANADSIIHQNAFELLRMLHYGEREGIGISVDRDKLQNIIKNREISGAIWKAATSRPIQYRSHSNIREIWEQFGNIAGANEHLIWPKWLEKSDEKRSEGIQS